MSALLKQIVLANQSGGPAALPIGKLGRMPTSRSAFGPKGVTAVATLTTSMALVGANVIQVSWYPESVSQIHGEPFNVIGVQLNGGNMSSNNAAVRKEVSVAALRDMSDLTGSQIARLFGVSRRTVQNWIAGGPMAARHEERLAYLYDVIAKSGNTPAERRKRLLSSADGVSPFHQLLAEVGDRKVLSPPAISARDALGV